MVIRIPGIQIILINSGYRLTVLAHKKVLNGTDNVSVTLDI